MYKNKKILALIPARGGSKGIKNKNIIEICGQPLIAYTIQAAIDSACFDEIIVSTDSQQIAEVAQKFGATVPFLRPANLAADNSKSEAVVKHALTFMNSLGKYYDLIVVLQPTSPLRKAKHIIEALDLLVTQDLPSLASISPVTEHPLFMRAIDEKFLLKKILSSPSNIRRQDLPQYYILNGAIYINRPEDVYSEKPANDNLYGYIMDQNSGVDINTLEDIEKVKKILLSKKKNVE